MESQTKNEPEHEVQKQEIHKEDTRFERTIFEVYNFSILQYAIHSANHKQIAQIKKVHEKKGYDFNKYFSSAERQLRKINNPENTLKPFINSLNNIIHSF